jgi:unsaturated rhamnogalacturonyl hydrolase
MKRRQFLCSTAIVSAAAAGGTTLLTSCTNTKTGKTDPLQVLISKVMQGMLSVQRRSWEQGVASQALLELGETNLVILLAAEAVLQQFPDGRLAEVDSRNAVNDPASNGEAVLFAWEHTRDIKFRQAADDMLGYLMKTAPRAPDGTIYHNDDAPKVWIDGLYMAPPFIAIAGEPGDAVKQVEGYRKYLWNKNKKMFSHMWDEASKSFARADCWGVGNGWAAAGMTRIVKALPESMREEKQRIVGYITEVLEGCIAHQRKDGLFHDVVDDPSTFIETNLAQMLAYTIYRGCKAGWLDRSYLLKADSMRAAAHSKVDAYGMVQGVCGSPTFDHYGTACEGQAFFLLMEAAFRDLNAK